MGVAECAPPGAASWPGGVRPTRPGRDLNGRGIASRAVALVCEWGFGTAGLHRIEAATLVDNFGSQTVLRRNAFAEMGISRRYLRIAGEWRDHLLFARTAED